MNDSLKDLESRAFHAYWGDGLLDTMIGTAIALIGLSWWQDIFVLGTAFPPVAATLWYPLRKKLIEPRCGYVEFSGGRELKSRSFMHGMTAFMGGAALLGVFIYFWWDSGAVLELRRLIPAMPAMLIGLMMIPVAAFTGCRRFYGYTGVMALAGVATVLLGSRPGPLLLAGGMVVALAGATMLGRFLATHPANPDAR
jgi:hypothetical protein